MSSNKEVIDNLLEQNDELENYFRNTIIPQLFIDARFILRKFTPPAMKQFNLVSGDIGKSIHDIHDNFRFPSIIENIQAVIDSNEILEKEIQTSDMRWYQMNIIPYIKQYDNRPNGVIITFIEITFRIRDLKEQEKLIADHETLLDTLSHDIKNPLATLVMAIDQFKNVSPEDEPSFKNLLKIVETALSKMHKVINELTEVRREEHKYKAVEEILNFEHILEDVCLTLKENIIESGAVIKSNINVSEIFFSRRKLRSVVYNLIHNAIKFRSPNRQAEIFVTTSRNEDCIIISVKDNGIGIDENKFDPIFSKYYRLENSIEGSGIGLYLVKEIVKNAGGSISLESQIDVGSEFKVHLKV